MNIGAAIVRRLLAITAVIFALGFVVGYLSGCAEQPQLPPQPARCQKGLMLYCEGRNRITEICYCVDPRELERAIPEGVTH